MPRHYRVFKYDPSTHAKVLLHEKIPEQMVDWTLRQEEYRLSENEKENGWTILKEAQGWSPGFLDKGPFSRAAEREKRLPVAHAGTTSHIAAQARGRKPS